jgi:cytochrome b561
MPDDRDAVYGRAMRALHWSTAALLLGPYLIVWAIGHIASEADAVWLAMLPVNPELGIDLVTMHGCVAVALLGLIGMHAIAALHHHFVRRDTVLVRILPAAGRVVMAVSTKRCPLRGDLS